MVSDEHKELVGAVRRCFQGAVWQRCQVRFGRNVLAHTPSRHKAAMTGGFKQERLIREVRRRNRVIRIFPSEESAHRLIGTLLAEIHEEGHRRYLEMSAFDEWWKAQQPSDQEDDKVVGIDH